jgi:hypothetical protein
MLTKVVSDCQTGIDRVGLDAALEAGLTVGCWCQKRRLAESGRAKKTADNPYRCSEYA